MKSSEAFKGQRVQMNALGRALHKGARTLPQRGYVSSKPNPSHVWANTIVVRYDGSRANRTVPASQWEPEPSSPTAADAKFL